ncbi:MAG: tetratricopeptide (TPR) repeat protein [Yoonia sp.]|jgi:tetratricopeptide (TPR) repeat protein
MFEAFFGFLAEYTLELGGGAALIAIVETVFKPFRKIFGRTETVKLDDETKAAIAPVQANDITTLTVPEFIRLRRELKADIERDLEAADESEKSTLRAQIADLEAQIANPDEALVVANKRIADLEDILERAGNDIGGDRIIAAKAALEKGDYSIADDIFAEIEAREEMAVQNAARAAFGRGEVAEAQVRWHDAYTHYKRAVHLHETTDHLKSFSMMAWRMGKREEAVAADEKLVSRAKTDFGGGSKEHAVQLNNLGTGVRDQGRYAEAEGLFREALRIRRGHDWHVGSRLCHPPQQPCGCGGGSGAVRRGRGALPRRAADRCRHDWHGASRLCRPPQQSCGCGAGTGAVRRGRGALPRRAADHCRHDWHGASLLCQRPKQSWCEYGLSQKKIH